MSSTPTTTQLPLTGSHEHVVEFYETDAYLVESVAGFIAPSLHDLDAGIVIATAEHRAGVAERLAGAGIDVAGTAREDRYIAVDAGELLGRLLVDGAPDPRRFHEEIGGLIDRAAHGRRAVRIYGELVALLLERGDAAATLALEDMWNEQAASHRFELLCGYPLDAFNDDARGPFKRICAVHTAVMPAESYSLMSDVQQQQQLVAKMRREADGLRTELDRLRREQEDLIELAYHDPITGLANRRAFDAHLAREWALAARDETDSLVLIADLDGFKQLNDTYGHAAGDEVLREFGLALRAATRSTDVAARIGGDEFGILLVRCDERAAHRFRDRLRVSMAELISDRYGQLGVSLGHASLRHSSSPETALDRADLAMLAIKRSRRRRRRNRPGPA